MEALMSGMEPEEEGAGSKGGAGALALPGEGCDVVPHRVKGALAHLRLLRHNIKMGDQPSQLQIRIGDIAHGIIERDHLLLDALRKGLPPEARAAGTEPDAAHAGFGGVHATNERRRRGGEEFRPPSGASSLGREEPAKIIQGRVHQGREAQPCVGRCGRVGREELLEM